MKRKKIAIEDIYRKNHDTGDFLIEVALNSYEDIFNEWDPAPFKRRDLDPDLITYLERCLNDIPKKCKIELNFMMPDEKKNKEKEKRVIQGLKTLFLYEADLAHRDNQKLNQRTITHFIIGGILIFGVTFLNRFKPDGFAVKILYDGLTIGAWVFTWDSIATFFFGKRRIKSRLIEYQKFANAKIVFLYSK